jgi:transcriptional regulator HilA, main transcriptional regulator of SPI1
MAAHCFRAKNSREKSVARMQHATGTLKESMEPEFSFGNFRLWPDGTFFREQTQIHLPPKELAALRLLLTHAGQVVTPAELKQALWGDVHVTSESVPRCLSALRAQLEPEQCIQTIYKRGYRLAGPVRHHSAQDHPLLRVAIMPFATGHNVPEHLGSAIAEEVTGRLTATGPSWVSVLARDSVFTLARRGLTAVQAGEAFHADLVLAGTLLAMPNHYRLRVEMIRVQDGIQIWVEDALAPQGQLLELEAHLVQRLIFRLGGENNPGLNPSNPGPVQPDAYAMFLLGRQEWKTRERRRMQDGMQYLIQATELDPTFISAQIDVAELSLTEEFYGFLAPDTAARQIRRIADSIPDMASQAPTLLPMVGWVKFHVDRNLAGALDLFSASAQLPHGPSATRLRAFFALSRRRFDEALEWLESALLLDPFAPWLHGLQAWTLHLAGRRAKSIEAIEKALDQFPDHKESQAYGALILAFNGQADRGARLAQDLVRRVPYLDIAAGIQAYALACNGQRDQAREILERLQWLSRERFVLRSFTAAGFAALGEVEEAVSELRAADESRCPWFFQMLADPRLESLHTHPGFERMRDSLKKMEFSTADNFEYQA